MNQYIGYPNSYFESIYREFAGNWDGVPCSEIACCFSYLAGNLSKIYVSNYAEGLVDLYQQNGRFGTTPQPGAFIWFDYHDGNGPSHTGRVAAVDTENGIITTVEGNVGGIVRRLTYSIDYAYIYGYGYPNYTDEEMPDPPGPGPGPIPGEKKKMPVWMMTRRIL